MRYTVVVADPIGEQGIELMREAPELDVVSAVGSPEQLTAALAGAHALVVRSSTRVTDDLMVRAPNLKVIARAGMGVDNIDVAAATRRGITVLNTAGANAISAAEHTFALLLSLLRCIPWAMESVLRGEWRRQAFGGSELYGKTLSTLGLGRIGQHVVRLARGFGMQVLAFDPYVPEETATQLQVGLVSLETALSRADAVTLHLPLNDDTRLIVNETTLGLIRPSAVLINTARGGLIDDAALVAALDAGRLAGAALDVFATEPLPTDSPLRASDKILLTPHLAASTAEAQERVSLEVYETVHRALVRGDIHGALNPAGLQGR
jgi:D-3-phosphoglycerate dehydrogenase